LPKKSQRQKALGSPIRLDEHGLLQIGKVGHHLPIRRVAAQPTTLEKRMITPKLTTIAIAAFVMTATAAKADILLLETSANQEVVQATDTANTADNRLLIVNGNTGHVIYDDGKDDLFCVTRKVIMGYNEYGYPIRKRTMRCR
jgi:hypothetical protein